MKRIFSILAVCCVAVAAVAQADGAFRKINISVTAEGKKIISNFLEVAPATDEVAFANALVWTVNEVCPVAHEGLSNVDFARKSFDCKLGLASSDGKSVYKCNASFRVADGIMLFNISDIVVESEVVVVKKSTPIERLQPEKKPAHKEILSDIEKQMTSVLYKMFTYVQSHEIDYAINWELISVGQVKKGMHPDEVLMSVGKPLLVTGTTEPQWKYSDSFYIFFKNGVAKTILR